MNIIDVIKKGFLCGFISVEDIERYVRGVVYWKKK